MVELLALRVPHAVPEPVLVAALWGDRPPSSATKTLQTLVSRARAARCWPSNVSATGIGWRSTVTTSTLIDWLVSPRRRGRYLPSATAPGRPRCWTRRSRCVAAPPSLTFATALRWGEAVALDELIAAIREDRFDARLTAGDHHALIGELEAAVTAEPLRERRWAQLMIALHRDGQRGWRPARLPACASRALADTGLQPGPGLVALERHIVDDDLDTSTHQPVSGAHHSGANEQATRIDRDTEGVPLPGRRNSFVGRAAERRRIVDRLRRARLVTVVGAAGAGKTRLAAEVARTFEDTEDVVYVDLVPARDTSSVTAAVAERARHAPRARRGLERPRDPPSS